MGEKKDGGRLFFLPPSASFPVGGKKTIGKIKKQEKAARKWFRRLSSCLRRPCRSKRLISYFIKFQRDAKRNFLCRGVRREKNIVNSKCYTCSSSKYHDRVLENEAFLSKKGPSPKTQSGANALRAASPPAKSLGRGKGGIRGRGERPDSGLKGTVPVGEPLRLTGIASRAGKPFYRKVPSPGSHIYPTFSPRRNTRSRACRQRRASRDCARQKGRGRRGTP